MFLKFDRYAGENKTGAYVNVLDGFTHIEPSANITQERADELNGKKDARLYKLLVSKGIHISNDKFAEFAQADTPRKLTMLFDMLPGGPVDSNTFRNAIKAGK
jgi:hypothetical protein